VYTPSSILLAGPTLGVECNHAGQMLTTNNSLGGYMKANLTKINTLPLLAPAKVAGPLCGRAPASWWRDHAAQRIPAPIRLGGRTLWRTEELRLWVEAGCPGRKEWEALGKAALDRR
jgi:hypothetical protein